MESSVFFLCLFPNIVSDFNHMAQLRPLLFFGQLVAFFSGSESALRAEAKLV